MSEDEQKIDTSYPSLDPTDQIENLPHDELSTEEVRKLTPANSALLELAKKNPPPKEWLEGPDECLCDQQKK